MSDITTIVFDFGGVLIQWDPRNLYRRFFASSGEMERFLAEVKFAEWNSMQDRGRPFVEGVAELAARFPQHEYLIRAYHEHWEESVGEPILGTIEILRKLKALHYPVYGLSNWSGETFPLIRARHRFFELLDDYLISGNARVTKPDPAIFGMLLDKIARKAEECIFIDDSLANVEAARALGFVCIHFRSPAQLEERLWQLRIFQDMQ